MSRFPASNCPLDCKVYVGGLTRNASREELERAFGHYGKLRNVFVARNPPGFAFIEFEDTQDAEDAVKALDGRYEYSLFQNFSEFIQSF
jgi:RNA recognition motif-containing protein